MAELMGLAFGLLVVAAVGHGIWLVLAWMLRGFKPASALPTTTTAGAEADATRRHLRRLLQDNKIDLATYERVLRAMMPKAPPSATPPPVPPTSPQMAPIESTIQAPAVPTAPPAQPVSVAPPPPRPKPAAPKPPLSQVLASFMQEKNIRWGELIGGMLVVFCSAGLVLSWWDDIAAVPALKFFLFTAVTAAIYGVGLYTGHRWKLPTTSRGLLTIASLLVPLNFLAIAAFSQGQAATDPMVLAGEFVAIAVFGFLALKAGKVIAPMWPGVLAFGLIGAGAMPLVIRRFADVAMSDATATVLAMLPLAWYAAMVHYTLVRAWRWRTISRPRAHAMLLALGLTSFAALLGIGLLAHLSGDAALMLQRIAPIVCLYGLPALGCGLSMWRGVRAKELAPLRAAGTGGTVMGVMLMLAAVWLAWPATHLLVATTLIIFAVCTATGLLYRMPAMHLPAGACATAAYLMIWQLVTGGIKWFGHSGEDLLRATISGDSGKALLPLAVLAGGATVIFSRRRRSDDALWYGIVSACIVGLSLLLTTAFGFGRDGDPHDAAFIYAIYAVAALIAAAIISRPVITWIGSGLALAALVQAIVYKFHLPLPWPTAMLIHALAACAAGRALHRHQAMASPLIASSMITSIIAAASLWELYVTEAVTYPWLRAAGVAAVWFGIAGIYRSRGWFAAGQGALTAAVAWFTLEALRDQPSTGVFDPRVFYPVAASILGLNTAWVAARLWLRRLNDDSAPGRIFALADLRPLTFDGAATVVLTAAAVVYPYLSIFEPAMTELFGSGHPVTVYDELNLYGASSSAWLLVGGVMIYWFIRQWERVDGLGVLGLLLGGWSACALIAAGSQPAGVATGLRWAWTGYLITASAAIWLRTPLLRSLRQIGWPLENVQSAWWLITLRAAVILLTVLPLVFITSFVPVIDLPKAAILSYVLPVALAGAVMFGHALRDRLRRFLFYAASLANFAATVWWVLEWRISGDGAILNGVCINAIALAAAGLVSLFVELKAWRPRPAVSVAEQTLHQVAALLCITAVIFTAAIMLVGKIVEDALSVDARLVWGALASTAVLLLACRLDTAATVVKQGFYFLGLSAIALAVQHINADPHTLVWALSLSLGGYVLATSLIARRVLDEPPAWLFACNLALAIGVAGYACAASHDYDATATTALLMRVAAALAVFVAGAGIGVQPRGATAALIFFAAGALAFGWAWIEPQSANDLLLNRIVIALAALTVTVGVYSLGLVKRLPPDQPWRQSAARVLPWLIGLGGIVLLSVHLIELGQFLFDDSVEIDPWAIGVVIAAQVILFALAILMAMGRTGSFEPSMKWRMGMVYAAEAILGLMFLHIRTTMPWLFHGFFQAYWPLIVMAVAFPGVGLSEWFSKRDENVFAEPLLRTGAFLPLLPVLGFLVMSSQVDYAALLVVVGILYGVLSVLRASFGFGVLAALAANGALWSLLDDTQDLSLLQHPQMWMIPPAVSILIASHLNRRNLTPAQMGMFRYVCLMVIYVSSTADILINGVTETIWLPMVLAGLSVAGAMAGIALRLRSFLYLGSAFLLLSLIIMIRFAQVNFDMMWLWWLAGTCLGFMIIAMFAVFERKRSQMLDVLEQLKAWEA